MLVLLLARKALFHRGLRQISKDLVMLTGEQMGRVRITSRPCHERIPMALSTGISGSASSATSGGHVLLA